jgi:hypothetical protein
MNTIKNVINSTIINYKIWIVIFICIYFIHDPIFYYKSFYTLLIMYILIHQGHYISHFKILYPLNIIHSYHHSSNLALSHILEILLEFVSILSVVVIDYLFSLKFFCYWTVFMYYLAYTTIHNINYTIFHINHIHEKHHKYLLYNMGPDICDIIFQTKYEPDTDIENMDHQIPNIIAATIIILLIKQYWNTEWFREMFESFYLVCAIIVLLATIILYIIDIKYNIISEKDFLFYNLFIF